VRLSRIDTAFAGRDDRFVQRFLYGAPFKEFPRDVALLAIVAGEGRSETSLVYRYERDMLRPTLIESRRRVDLVGCPALVSYREADGELAKVVTHRPNWRPAVSLELEYVPDPPIPAADRSVFDQGRVAEVRRAFPDEAYALRLEYDAAGRVVGAASADGRRLVSLERDAAGRVLAFRRSGIIDGTEIGAVERGADGRAARLRIEVDGRLRVTDTFGYEAADPPPATPTTISPTTIG
jgi:YD repeat-containing protein